MAEDDEVWSLDDGERCPLCGGDVGWERRVVMLSHNGSVLQPVRMVVPTCVKCGGGPTRVFSEDCGYEATRQ
jgi:hypothetical protein